MLGTIVNTVAILVGGAVGLLLKGGLKERFRTIINQGVGLAVLLVGLSTTLANMLAEGASAVLFIVCLALGGVLGEWIDIEEKLLRIGDALQARFKQKPGEKGISVGFVSASLLFCVGTMAVLGPIESGLSGNHSILFAKSMLDGIISVVMASTLGLGVLFSAASVLVYQGALTLLAVWVAPLMSEAMLRELSIVGGILIMAIGINMLEMTREKIRVGNLLPAVFLPVLFYVVASIFQ